jgi:hypothetical protein
MSHNDQLSKWPTALPPASQCTNQLTNKLTNQLINSVYTLFEKASSTDDIERIKNKDHCGIDYEYQNFTEISSGRESFGVTSVRMKFNLVSLYLSIGNFTSQSVTLPLNR